QLQEKLKVLKEREDLRFAALDSWNAVAQTMPSGLTLDVLNFADGTKLDLRGTAPSDQVTIVTDFYDYLRRAKRGDQPLFSSTESEGPRTSLNPGGATVSWSFDLELRRTPVK